MRVLHAFNQPRSGGGSLAASLATIAALRGQGVEVEVFTRNSRDLPEGFAGRLQAGLSAFYPAEAVRAFGEQLRRFRPDLVHINELYPLVSPWVLRHCRAEGIPVVMTVDDFHLTCPSRNHFREGKVCTECLGGREHRMVVNNCRGSLAENLVNTAYSAMVRQFALIRGAVDHYVTPSHFSSRWVVEQVGVDPSRVTTVQHTIDLPPAPVADASAGSYIAFAGRFVPEKGIDVLLAAARLMNLPVALSRNQHHFVTIDLPPEVQVVVTQGRDDLAAFYRGARMLVVPSIWFETFGVVGAEAMAHGIPVVGSNFGAVADLVDDGVDGLLFRMGDAADLARQAASLWHDPVRCRSMGQRARAKAETLFPPDVHARRMLAVYDQVITTARRGAGQRAAA